MMPPLRPLSALLRAWMHRLRQQVRHAVAICVRGKVERRDGVVHVLVANARDIGAALTRGSDAVSAQSRDFH